MDPLALIDNDKGHIIAIGREFRFESGSIFLNGKFVGYVNEATLTVRELDPAEVDVYADSVRAAIRDGNVDFNDHDNDGTGFCSVCERNHKYDGSGFDIPE